MKPTRRNALGLAVGALTGTIARPAIAQSSPRILRFIPSADLSALDPIWTTAYVVRNHGYMVFDTLFSMDSAFNLRPQMAETFEEQSGGRVSIIRLRQGLKFHDGSPVLARDCVASIRRWAARDGFGQSLMLGTDELLATDDRTITFRLKKPFPRLREALGKLSVPIPFMMPERLAQTDPRQQIVEMVGSGPFRFLADEWRNGVGAAYARFDGYIPRNEKADGLAGGKFVNIDRVEWKTIPDRSTAVSAIQTGQVDWLEQTSPELLPVVEKNNAIRIGTLDPIGTYVFLRFNALVPPFNDVMARRAVMRAVRQPDYLIAMAESERYYRECKAFFPCGLPLSSGDGSAVMSGNLEEARAMLKSSSYDGSKVVVLASADQALLAPLGEITADLLRKIGFQVDLVTTDWGTLLARRASQKPADQGGWNIFHTTAVAPEFMNPASHIALRGNGPSGWVGWFSDPKLEELRNAWFEEPDDAKQKVLASEMERRAFDQAPYVPLGQIRQPTIIRKNITDVVEAPAPVFWNLKKA